MAIRSIAVLSLIVAAGGITNTEVAAAAGIDPDKLTDLDPENINLAGDYAWTGNHTIDGVAVDPTQNLLYMTVVAASLDNVGNGTYTGMDDALDGVNLAQHDDVLLMGETGPQYSGLYNVDVLGTGADGEWSRCAERNAAAELPVGMLVYAKSGTTNGGKMFRLNSFGGTLGTDGLGWEEVEEGPSVINGGEPLSISGANGVLTSFDIAGTGSAAIGKSIIAFAVYVDTVLQLSSQCSITAGGGTAGVDLLVFADAPGDGASIEIIALLKG